MMKRSVYVVDDEASFRSYLTTMLAGRGYETTGIETGNDLVAKLTSSSIPSIILLDVLLPDSDGIQVMARIRQMGITAPVIMLSGMGQVRTVVEAMKLGAADFLMKPFEYAALEDAIEKALEHPPEKDNLRRPAAVANESSGFVTANGNMQRLSEIVRRVAATDVPILITGESGVGKEVMARYAHVHSGRHDRPFVKVNCAAMPHELLESELFGYEKGAFTGAHALKKGRFELAEGGTLFLDEIGDVNLSTQVKLLRVLQEKEFERLGGTSTIRSNVRLITGTNKDLEKAMTEGKFREDLYYRLNVFAIFVPPLRERKADLLLLADHFLQKYAREHKRDIRRISTPAIDMLTAYHWPGNVRELENVIERAILVCDSNVIHGHHLPPTLQTAQASGTVTTLTLGDAVAAYEKDIVLDALKTTRGNRAKAARLLGTTERIINYKVRKYGIDSDRFRD